MNDVVHRFHIALEQVKGFEIVARFDKEKFAPLTMDEPEPLGRDAAPNAARILAAAIGDCLTASLVFCLKKAGRPIEGVRAEVDVEIVRNERRRLRIGQVAVKLHAGSIVGDPSALACIESFQDFCIVTESVRNGVPVDVRVER